MRVRIHRGAREIGGSCVELESRGRRLVLDLGLPIESRESADRLLPNVPGLTGRSQDRPEAIFLSHPHQDHVGLATFAHPDIPIYLGCEADRLMRAAHLLGAPGAKLENTRHYRHRQPVRVGPFTVTPFLVDHSAFDAYAFLIEADGIRLFYSGDLRAHGRKSRLFEQLLEFGPRNLNAMLLEGTTLSRDAVAPARTETGLEEDFLNAMQSTRGIVLTCFSAQNIDRFVTVYRAARRANRVLVIDLYFAHLLRTLGRKSLPDPANSDLRVFLPSLLKKRIVRHALAYLVAPYGRKRIYIEEIFARRSELAMTFRTSFTRDFESFDGHGGRLIYSQWPGYLDRDRLDLRKWCQDNGLILDIIHTSGHADRDDLIRLVKALDPGFVIPIHTVAPQSYTRFFPHVRLLPDRHWLDFASG